MISVSETNLKVLFVMFISVSVSITSISLLRKYLSRKLNHNTAVHWMWFHNRFLQTSGFGVHFSGPEMKRLFGLEMNSFP